MANTATAVPLKTESKWAAEEKALKQEFDTKKKYAFQLAEENMEFEHPVFDMRTKKAVPHKKFKPYQNLVFTSQIVWKEERANLRYYDGCTTIFVAEQPKEKDVIDQLCKQTKPRNFLEGKLIVEGTEKWLLIYLMICSWNAESPFRTSSANQIFVSLDTEKLVNSETLRLDQIEEALGLAKSATKTKMMIHGSYLGIPTIDWSTSNELTEKEFRMEYRKMASREPAKFIESYGNQTLEIKYYIEQALQKGTINNKFNPNKATWGSANTEICDISGLKSNEAISQRLFEFSKTELGEEFVIQLKAISE